jgi:mono/diheme cytochrome c family protein
MEQLMKSKLRVSLPMFTFLPLLALAQEPSLALAQTAATDTAGGAPPYQVVDGNKVDLETYAGWKTWRAMACERCHGANQEGLVGPSLVNSLKVLTKEQFVTTVTNGRPEKGMPNFGAVQKVVKNIDGLYAFLKGRSDGAIKPGRLKKLEAQ